MPFRRTHPNCATEHDTLKHMPPCDTRVRRKKLSKERTPARRKVSEKPHTAAGRSGLRGKHRKLGENYKEEEETRLSQRHAGLEAHGPNVHTGTDRQPRGSGIRILRRRRGRSRGRSSRLGRSRRRRRGGAYSRFNAGLKQRNYSQI